MQRLKDTVLVCRTNDYDNNPSAEHFLFGITEQEFLQDLNAMRRVYETARNALGTLYCLEQFNQAGEWGRVAGYTPAQTGAWEFADISTKILKDEGIELESIKVTEDGVIFSAARTHDDPPVYFETPLLPWSVIETLAMCDYETATPGTLFPKAKINMTENAELPND